MVVFGLESAARKLDGASLELIPCNTGKRVLLRTGCGFLLVQREKERGRKPQAVRSCVSRSTGHIAIGR